MRVSYTISSIRHSHNGTYVDGEPHEGPEFVYITVVYSADGFQDLQIETDIVRRLNKWLQLTTKFKIDLSHYDMIHQLQNILLTLHCHIMWNVMYYLLVYFWNYYA